jgi:hypothetical protein
VLLLNECSLSLLFITLSTQSRNFFIHPRILHLGIISRLQKENEYRTRWIGTILKPRFGQKIIKTCNGIGHPVLDKENP